MKTIDEVITGMTELILSGKTADVKSTVRDALRYLKEYRKDKQIYAYDIVRRHFELAERNDPLTWDELKTMEGKPVWVEDEDSYNRWEIINGVYDNGISFGDYFLNKNEFGTVWQAYRKEKK